MTRANVVKQATRQQNVAETVLNTGEMNNFGQKSKNNAFIAYSLNASYNDVLALFCVVHKI